MTAETPPGPLASAAIASRRQTTPSGIAVDTQVTSLEGSPAVGDVATAIPQAGLLATGKQAVSGATSGWLGGQAWAESPTVGVSGATAQIARRDATAATPSEIQGMAAIAPRSQTAPSGAAVGVQVAAIEGPAVVGGAGATEPQAETLATGKQAVADGTPGRPGDQGHVEIAGSRLWAASQPRSPGVKRLPQRRRRSKEWPQSHRVARPLHPEPRLAFRWQRSKVLQSRVTPEGRNRRRKRWRPANKRSLMGHPGGLEIKGTSNRRKPAWAASQPRSPGVKRLPQRRRRSKEWPQSHRVARPLHPEPRLAFRWQRSKVLQSRVTPEGRNRRRGRWRPASKRSPTGRPSSLEVKRTSNHRNPAWAASQPRSPGVKRLPQRRRISKEWRHSRRVARRIWREPRLAFRWQRSKVPQSRVTPEGWNRRRGRWRPASKRSPTGRPSSLEVNRRSNHRNPAWAASQPRSPGVKRLPQRRRISKEWRHSRLVRRPLRRKSRPEFRWPRSKVPQSRVIPEGPSRRRGRWRPASKRSPTGRPGSLEVKRTSNHRKPAWAASQPRSSGVKRLPPRRQRSKEWSQSHRVARPLRPEPRLAFRWPRSKVPQSRVTPEGRNRRRRRWRPASKRSPMGHSGSLEVKRTSNHRKPAWAASQPRSPGVKRLPQRRRISKEWRHSRLVRRPLRRKSRPAFRWPRSKVPQSRVTPEGPSRRRGRWRPASKRSPMGHSGSLEVKRTSNHRNPAWAASQPRSSGVKRLPQRRRISKEWRHSGDVRRPLRRESRPAARWPRSKVPQSQVTPEGPSRRRGRWRPASKRSPMGHSGSLEVKRRSNHRKPGWAASQPRSSGVKRLPQRRRISKEWRHSGDVRRPLRRESRPAARWPRSKVPQSQVTPEGRNRRHWPAAWCPQHISPHREPSLTVSRHPRWTRRE